MRTTTAILTIPYSTTSTISLIALEIFLIKSGALLQLILKKVTQILYSLAPRLPKEKITLSISSDCTTRKTIPVLLHSQMRVCPLWNTSVWQPLHRPSNRQLLQDALLHPLLLGQQLKNRDQLEVIRSVLTLTEVRQLSISTVLNRWEVTHG